MLAKRHLRGGKSAFKKKDTVDNCNIIDFLNVRGIGSKIYEFNRHLELHKSDIFGLVETFLSSNDRPPNLNQNFRWIGKCRSGDTKKGGIGICLRSSITVLDDNLINSQNDMHERLWVLIRLNNVKVAVGVAYFPNDGVCKPKTDELFFELLENTTSFHELGYEVILMGDFNGRCVSTCPFSTRNIPYVFPSYNGKRLTQFIEVSELSLINTMSCCRGLFTRIMNNQRSTLDYILVSDNLAKQVISAFIDDVGSFDLHSDHVVFTLKLKANEKVKIERKSQLTWKLNDNTDWESFQKLLHTELVNWSILKFSGNIDDAWLDWKHRVSQAAENSIGLSKKPRNYKTFWDKEIDSLIKSRKTANKLVRIHNKTRPYDSDTGKILSETYKERFLYKMQLKRENRVIR